jgi:LysM repeat protein
MKTYTLIAISFFLSLENGFSEERNPSPSSASFYEVTIRKEETLSSLALRHRTSVAKLVETNGLASANLIVAGQTLRIARKETGTWANGRIQILRGDTLNLIALVLGVRPEDLAAENGIQSHDRLVAGEWLRIPSRDGKRAQRPQKAGKATATAPSQANTYSYPDPFQQSRDTADEGRISAPSVPEVATESESDLVQVKITEVISAQEAADQFGLSLETLIKINPELRRESEIEKGKVLLVPKVFLGID